jgi:hypothetical protein
MQATGRLSGHPRVVRDGADLTALLRAGRKAARAPIVLELAGIGDAEAAATSVRLGELGNECGCAWGARAMFAGFGVAIAAVVLRDDVRSASFLFHLPLVLAAGVLCALAGKGLGVMAANGRYRDEIEALLRRTHPAKEV